MSITRRWNLNELEGRYVGTNIVESVIELHLGLKRVNGSMHFVGRFRLDLNALADDGFVTRRIIEGNRVFDVQIYRGQDGNYSVGVRREHTSPIHLYEIR